MPKTATPPAKSTARKSKSKAASPAVSIDLLRRAYVLMRRAEAMADVYDRERQTTRYVHSTSRGHEAIQLAAAFHLTERDYAAPYYRDESLLLGLGLQPYELMLQLLGKADDPFTGGRSYYGHPNLRRAGVPLIPHQSSATGMQAIPATGMAHAIQYLMSQGLPLRGMANQTTDHQTTGNAMPVVLCSIGDGAMTEGEVSEALQMAVLKQMPIIYLVQDNGWGISATAAEMRAMDAFEFAAGFKGLHCVRVDGRDFAAAYTGLAEAYDYVRAGKGPVLVHAPCPLLGHHTSGVRREWYRGADLDKHRLDDPLPRLHAQLLEAGVDEEELVEMALEARAEVEEHFRRAVAAPNPDPATVVLHEFAPTSVTEERGERRPANGEKVVMVDAALHAVDDILREYPEALFYGQDVGGELGGVFREAALLAKKYGDGRVFNTPIQEAYIVGSTAGMSAVGAKPIVEIQFADYIWPGLNQLVEELSKSCYLSMGKFPVQALIRVPIGAYGGGGPYHSGSVESTLLTIRGIKVVYPSNAADMKGLLKAAFLDPNPVVLLEHKGLYWSKVPGTEEAKTIEPAADYILPLGKAATAFAADADAMEEGDSCVVITYGMGVYWATAASKMLGNRAEVLDLRTLNPLDWEAVMAAVRRHNKVMVLTEEPLLNSFAESLAGRIQRHCFRELDVPVFTLGALDLPAIALNVGLEAAMLPSAEKVRAALEELLKY